MKVILSNYRYFISGGPERYLFSIKALFENNAIEVFPFSVKSKKNFQTPWHDYFLSPIGSDDSVNFDEYAKEFKTYVKVLERIFYSPEGFVKARRFARIVKPDLVYSLHFLNKMSPSIIDGFKALGLPVVVRLSDFGIICPQAHLFDGYSICEKCINGSFFNAVRQGCVKKSKIGSLLKAFAWTFHEFTGSISRVDAFVSPSRFTIQKYVEAGYPKEKFYHIPTFIDVANITPQYSNNGYILYFGRLVKEKGVHVLLEAYRKIPRPKPKLVVIGDIHSSDYSRELVNQYSLEITFLNFMPKDQLCQYIRHAMFVVVPSIWYDNLPNVVLETYAHGKSVIVPQHGCFTELVRENQTGLFFKPGNAGELLQTLLWAIDHPKEITEMGRNARTYVKQNYSPDRHYCELMKVFNKLL